jgi:hypothetical protein
MRMDNDQCYFMISRIVSQANAALSLAYSKLLLSGDLSEGLAKKLEEENSFNPSKGNVIFACSNSNWAFTLDNFCAVFAQALGGANPEKVRPFLWGDYYFSSKDKKILKTPLNQSHSNTFTQFVLKNISNVYSSIMYEKDQAKLEKIVKVLKIDLPQSITQKLESDPGLVVTVI